MSIALDGTELNLSVKTMQECKRCLPSDAIIVNSQRASHELRGYVPLKVLQQRREELIVCSSIKSWTTESTAELLYEIKQASFGNARALIISVLADTYTNPSIRKECARCICKGIDLGLSIWIIARLSEAETDWYAWRALLDEIGLLKLVPGDNLLIQRCFADESRLMLALFFDINDISFTENRPFAYTAPVSGLLGEPIAALLDLPLSICSTIFNQNSLLSRLAINCAFRGAFLALKPILPGKDLRTTPHELHILQAHLSSKFAYSIGDRSNTLSFPIQPLSDTLGSSCYAVIEEDRFKYKFYRRALRKLLCNCNKDERTNVIVVLGGGRGPLVEIVLKELERMTITDIQVIVFDINSEAVECMRQRSETEPRWMLATMQQRLNICLSDVRSPSILRTILRSKDPPEPVIVSELLGSFGCNELAPECIDGFIKSSGFVGRSLRSIPKSFRSFAVPVHSTHVSHRLLCFARERSHSISELHTWLQCPVITSVQECSLLATPKEVFRFTHGLDDSMTRAVTCSFLLESTGALSGFLGYFEATLFEDIQISTIPGSETPGLSGWYPIFFPLCLKPGQLCNQVVTPGETVELRMERCSDAKRVWYEWSANIQNKVKFGETFVLNKEGCAFSIPLKGQS